MEHKFHDRGAPYTIGVEEELIERGNGAARQVVVYEANHDLV